ncbi:VOC family protein [Micromonospora sp. NPDC005305]|uniref:VOC family protein n=1 Tax=Micromonospora sp. NPDC005305 TaxID=3156875 RepID=UPI0033AC8B1B
MVGCVVRAVRRSAAVWVGTRSRTASWPGLIGSPWALACAAATSRAFDVGGGRHEPLEVRWPRVQAIVDKLVAAGGTVLRVDAPDGAPDHVTMADPEGNEFDVL